MARMISEQEKRAKRQAATRARKTEILKARGYSPEDAKALLHELDTAVLMKDAALLGKAIQAPAARLAEAEGLAVDALRTALALVEKAEPARAARIRRALGQISSRIPLAAEILK